MLMPKLSQFDMESLEVVVNEPTPDGILKLSLTHPLRARVMKIEEPAREQIPSAHAFAVYDLPQSFHTASPLSDLHNHWMSVRQQHISISLIFFAIGFSAITALAIAIFGWLPLDIAAYLLIVPSLVIWLVIGILHPDYGKLALKGFIIGILACFFYDSMRFVTITLGLWGDFIPRIGMWLLHTHKPDWVIGYIWRYVGDGGFMSVAFVVGYRLLKPALDVRIAALIFGIAIWLCLIGTILLAPYGSQMLFALTPITFSLSLLGHIIYGLAIGFLYHPFIRKIAARDVQLLGTGNSRMREDTFPYGGSRLF